MNTSFRIQGVNEFIRSLEKMDVETHSKLRLAFEKVSKDIEKDAKHKAPVYRGHSHRGGTLRDSITSKVNANPARIEARIGTNVKYAPYQEEGTSGKAHSRQVKGRNESRLIRGGSGIPAIHYLRDAYESNVPSFVMRLESIIHSLRL